MNEHTVDQGRISVFLVDDHEIFRRGIRALLALEPDIDVIGEAETASSALARLPALRPDVALLDVRLPDGDGISVCREIRSALPETACLMLTGYGDDQALLGAIVAGAAGYVSKQTCGTDLVSALRKVASGLSVLDPQASGLVMAKLRQRSASVDPVAALTEQEKRVLELIGEGLTNRQIAERMFLAEKTAKNYVSSLLTKLGMQRRTQAAAFAVRHADSHDELITSGASGPCPLGPQARHRPIRPAGRHHREGPAVPGLRRSWPGRLTLAWPAPHRPAPQPPVGSGPCRRQPGGGTMAQGCDSSRGRRV
jgi:DNA-binding NarL/FixJ family response regulator